MKTTCVIKYVAIKAYTDIIEPAFGLLLVTLAFGGGAGILFGGLALVAWLLRISMEAVAWLFIIVPIGATCLIMLLAKGLYWLRVQLSDALDTCKPLEE